MQPYRLWKQNTAAALLIIAALVIASTFGEQKRLAADENVKATVVINIATALSARRRFTF